MKWIVVMAAALGLAGCASKSEATAGPAQAPPPTDVNVAAVVQKDMPIYGDWVATLDGYVNANLQPQVSGYLIKQDYREGSLVHKDDVLFEIDPRPFQAALDQAKGQLAQAKGQVAAAEGQLEQARAQLGLAEINVKRDTPLAAARAIPQSQLDNDVQARAQAEALVKTAEASVQASQASVTAAQAAVETASLNLGFTKVRSLIDGIAGIATTQVGTLVSQTTVLTVISQVDPIKVYFPISEQEYLSLSGKLKSGSVDFLRQNSSVPLQLTLSNGSVYPRQGRVIFADRQVDPQTGTIRMVGAFANPGNVLRPGQFGRIRALIGFRKGALLIPQRAVAELQGRYQVAVVGPDNKVAIRTVEPGERVGELWIINSGLAPGERVVSEGTAKVREGSVVNPLPEAAGAARQ
ncbi:MAG TPA: efflux RND transporter periplasmic adaptor subunit [Bryobacteraceae bacterium]|jgi:RND family efflux transporter MFP subunit|nr:efflux RND transporter periplasmic adaptor subunit [Bryobacteraceae bacterium]